MSDQAEVRQQIEAWAVECADLETKGTRAIYAATVKYQKEWKEGASHEWIAGQVTAAGFSLASTTVGYRLAALEACPVTGQPSTETLALFWEAYGKKNNSGGGDEKDKNELEDWLHASMALRSQGGDEAIGYAASLLGLPTRQAIHAALHEKGDKDE